MDHKLRLTDATIIEPIGRATMQNIMVQKYGE
jgi:hypothetical protein